MDSDCVLVLATAGRDAALTVELLAQQRIPASVCADAGELSLRMPGSAMALIVEEVLTPEAVERIARSLHEQPPWSDFPIAIVGASRTSLPRWAPLGNVTFLDRPLRVLAMLGAVQGGLRARHRQYDARRAIESRDQFVAMLGHELRNPLSAIRLASDLLTTSTSLDQSQRYARVIDRQGRHLTRLVDDLLDVARVTYGKIALKLEPVDLGDVLRWTAQSLEPTFQAARLSFRASIAPGLRVNGDRVRLEQVFTNLLNNAVKYTPAGGNVELEAEARGARVVVTVKDSGIGIDPEMIHRIFDLFAQADRTLDRSRGGLGVGLTVVRNLVALHGGEVRATSAGLGAGTQLRVELALLPEEGERQVEPGAEVGAATTTRVVLVEDGDDVREALCALLEMRGHAVSTAADGPDGVERILDERPDIAFVDIGLPGFDGYEVARRVRARGATLPLVALSGYGQSEDKRRANEAGFDAHLTKPVDFERINAAIVASTTARP